WIRSPGSASRVDPADSGSNPKLCHGVLRRSHGAAGGSTAMPHRIASMGRCITLCAILLADTLAANAGTAPSNVTFTGKVVDARGQPAGGATVTVSLWEPPRTWR